MPTSKKQMVKLNQVKKAKAEELSKQAAAGSQEAKKKLKKLEKKLKWAAWKLPHSFFYWLMLLGNEASFCHVPPDRYGYEIWRNKPGERDKFFLQG